VRGKQEIEKKNTINTRETILRTKFTCITLNIMKCSWRTWS